MPTTRSQSGKLGQREGKNGSPGGPAAKVDTTKVTKLAGKKRKPKKPKQAAEKTNGKLQGGIDDSFQVFAQEKLAGSDPAGQDGELKMPEIPSPLNPFVKYLQFPPAKTLGQRDWPTISYGELAPKPRWRVCPATTDPTEFDQDNTRDLVKKVTGKWEIKGVRPTDDPRFDKTTHKPPLSHDHEAGLGALIWTFEDGDASAWNGLNRDQLYEYAFRCLWETIQCAPYARQIANNIRRGFYRDAVKHTAIPVPPLSKTPKEGNFPELEINVIHDVAPPTTQATWDFASNPYERDALAIRLDRADNDLHPVARGMFEYKRKLARKPRSLPGKYDDTSSEHDGDYQGPGESAGSGESKIIPSNALKSSACFAVIAACVPNSHTRGSECVNASLAGCAHLCLR